MQAWLIGYNLEVLGLEHLDFFNALKDAGEKRIRFARILLNTEHLTRS
jgi:hypothetical protein